MKKNLGGADRVLRLMLAMVLFILYFTNIVTGTWGVVILVAAIILGITALVSFCPLYALLGIRTCSTSKG